LLHIDLSSKVKSEQFQRQKKELLEKINNSKIANISLDVNVFTCVIGRKPTQAKYFVNDSSQFISIIEQLIQVNKRK